MPDFKTTNIIFYSIIIALIIAKLLFSFSLLWLLIPLFIYSVILFIGSKRICSQFYLKALCISEDKSMIHLSFDDGPHPEHTPEILQVLKTHNQKALFFCIGKNIEKYPEVFQKIIDEGHEIGNHSYSHSFYFDFMRTKQVLDELERTNRLIEHYTGKKNTLFRPPFGVTNPNIAKALKTTGMETIGWNVRSLDTVKHKPEVLKRIQKAKPGDIILFHDTKEHTPEILDEFLRSIDKRVFIS